MRKLVVFILDVVMKLLCRFGEKNHVPFMARLLNFSLNVFTVSPYWFENTSQFDEAGIILVTRRN